MRTAQSGAAEARVSLSPRDIPPLPTTMMELLGIANDPDVSFVRLEKVIARDQALTLRVLAVANSSYYGCSRKVESVRTAIALLGTRQVQNIASAMALAPAFDNAHGPALWAHGLATALWTGQVMEALGTPPIDYLFTAALLHDIGVVLLLRNAGDDENHCLVEARDTGVSLADLERQRLGIDHAALGASACVAWKLPERIIGLVGGHHDTSEARGGDAIDGAVLAIAEVLATRCGSPEVPGSPPPDWPAAALKVMGIGVEDLDALISRHDNVVAEAGAFG